MKVRLILCLCLASSIAFGGATKAPQRQPNILFIFADDQCHDTIRALGNHEIETPNLDRLAEMGTSFTHAFNMGAWGGAVCVASRAMLNTGRSVWNAGYMMRDPRVDPARPNDSLSDSKLDQSRFKFDTGGAQTLRRAMWANEYWSQLLKSAGYDTYFSGKWH